MHVDIYKDAINRHYHISWIESIMLFRILYVDCIVTSFELELSYQKPKAFSKFHRIRIEKTSFVYVKSWHLICSTPNKLKYLPFEYLNFYGP